jgi:hypothetical protein
MKLSAGGESHAARQSKAASLGLGCACFAPAAFSVRKAGLLAFNLGSWTHHSFRAELTGGPLGNRQGAANVSRGTVLEGSLARTIGKRGGDKKKSAARNRVLKTKNRSAEPTTAKSAIRSLFDSALFRNVVATGLAAAAAALVTRTSGRSDDLTSETPLRDEPYDDKKLKAKSPPIVTQVRKKAKSATAAVTHTAEAVTSGDAVGKVARRAKRVAKVAKAAITGSDDEIGALHNDQSSEPSAPQRTRKVRSDAGSQRRRPRVPTARSEAPQTGNLPGLAQTATSALALSAASVADDDVATESLEEQATEARPS